MSDQTVRHAGDLEQISGNTGYRLVRAAKVEGTTDDVTGRRKGHVGISVGNPGEIRAKGKVLRTAVDPEVNLLGILARGIADFQGRGEVTRSSGHTRDQAR